jgi:hypothetical protein
VACQRQGASLPVDGHREGGARRHEHRRERKPRPLLPDFRDGSAFGSLEQTDQLRAFLW